ncbi:type II toxin-antitoxin system HicA family toxin [Candidatus Pacearchaeota archaeon]|nr:type II toxin-antitoxin system HicA family toxin [Candidatus Pacearchaeota archaeon]
MSKLPHLSAVELAKILKKLGFEFIRQEGSHMFFRHPNGRTTVIPNHPGEDIGPGLLNKIIKKDLQLTREEFEKIR